MGFAKAGGSEGAALSTERFVIMPGVRSTSTTLRQTIETAARPAIRPVGSTEDKNSELRRSLYFHPAMGRLKCESIGKLCFSRPLEVILSSDQEFLNQTEMSALDSGDHV